MHGHTQMVTKGCEVDSNVIGSFERMWGWSNFSYRRMIERVLTSNTLLHDKWGVFLHIGFSQWEPWGGYLYYISSRFNFLSHCNLSRGSYLMIYGCQCNDDDNFLKNNQKTHIFCESSQSPKMKIASRISLVF